MIRWHGLLVDACRIITANRATLGLKAYQCKRLSCKLECLIGGTVDNA